MWNTSKRKVKDIIKTLVWSSRFGFDISPILYTLKFVHRITSVLLPIAEAYAASKVIGELVGLLGNNVTSPNRQLLFWIITSISIMAIRGIMSNLGEYLTVRYNYIYNLKAFGKYLSQIVNIDAQYHEDPNFKTLQKKSYDVLSWRIMAVVNRVQGFIASLISLFLISYIFFHINPIFILAIIIPVFLNFYINYKFGKEIYYIWEYGGEEAKHINNAFHAFDDKSVIHEAKIYGFGQYIVKIFSDFTVKFMNKNIKKTNVRYSLLSVAKLGEIAIFGIIQIKLIRDVLQKTIDVQQYLFYLQSVILISNTFNSLQEDVAQLIEFSQYVNNLENFFSLPQLITHNQNPKEVEKIAPKIEFQNVSFNYPTSEHLILKDVSFTINPGEHIALVGINGAGKSTIIKLLARFYDVTEGAIYINDMNIKDINLESYYELWGILFQQFAKYWLSIRENIGLGAVQNIDNIELVIKAAEKSGADKIADDLKDGYETMLSTDMKGGTDLSGGEWQKVGIARGLFSEPQLIVLDEPTSALDAISEAEVFEKISQTSTDTTMVIVSHRFSTVRNADRILVLSDGKIIDEGTHQELMENNEGLYNKMFTSQAKGYTD